MSYFIFIFGFYFLLSELFFWEDFVADS